MYHKIISILLLLILIGCANKDIHIEEDLSPQFKKAMKYFDKGKKL